MMCILKNNDGVSIIVIIYITIIEIHPVMLIIIYSKTFPAYLVNSWLVRQRQTLNICIYILYKYILCLSSILRRTIVVLSVGTIRYQFQIIMKGAFKLF